MTSFTVHVVNPQLFPIQIFTSQPLLWSSEVCVFFSGEPGSSRRSFQKSSRKSQPIREEEEEEFLGQMAFSDEGHEQGMSGRVREEPEGE